MLCVTVSSNKNCASAKVPLSNLIPAVLRVIPPPVSPLFKNIILSLMSVLVEFIVVVVPATVKFPVIAVVPVAPVSKVIVEPSATLTV